MGTAIRNDERYAKFLDLLPLHKYKVMPAAIAAGFGPEYARCKQKVIMQHALKHKLDRAKMLSDVSNYPNPDNKTMSEIVGISKQKMMKSLREIALNKRDLGTALKVLIPLAKEYGIVLNPDEESRVVTPILNITVVENDVGNTT